MLKTITATYARKTTVDNVVGELVNDGIPREKIYSDDTAMQDKVMAPETGSAWPRKNPASARADQHFLTDAAIDRDRSLRDGRRSRVAAQGRSPNATRYAAHCFHVNHPL